MAAVSGVGQLVMQYVVMQSIAQSNTQMGRAEEANGKMKQVAQQAEHSADDYAK